MKTFLKFTILDCDCPSILGMDFLRCTNPVIDWKSGSVLFNTSVQVTSCCSDANTFTGLDCENVRDGD